MHIYPVSKMFSVPHPDFPSLASRHYEEDWDLAHQNNIALNLVMADKKRSTAAAEVGGDVM